LQIFKVLLARWNPMTKMTIAPLAKPYRAPNGRADRNGKQIKIKRSRQRHGSSFPRTRLAAKCNASALKSQVNVESANENATVI
jgi:hypothetical protein